MKNIKLIASDLDGTLLNNKHKITEYNKKIIKAAEDIGIKFVISTGRPSSSAFKFLKELDSNAEMISFNGALVTDINNNTLYNEKLAPDTSLELIKIAEKYNIYYQAFSANSWNISDDSSKWLNYYTSIAEIYDYKIGFNNLKNKEDFHFIKFMFIAENEILKKIEKELNNIFSSNIYHTFSRDVYLEVMNPKVSKANALKFILDKYSISREETIAFGDNNNDLEMLEFAGISVAVDNAEKNIKEKCQYITKSNEENGVGEFLNKYLELGF